MGPQKQKQRAAGYWDATTGNNYEKLRKSLDWQLAIVAPQKGVGNWGKLIPKYLTKKKN